MVVGIRRIRCVEEVTPAEFTLLTVFFSVNHVIPLSLYFLSRLYRIAWSCCVYAEHVYMCNECSADSAVNDDIHRQLGYMLCRWMLSP